MTHGRLRRPAAALSIIVLLALLSACGLQFPTDPGGTLDRVSGGTLRVGATPNGEFVQVDGETVSGSEAKLVEGFAEHLGAEIAWTVSSEESLMRDLDEERLDLVIGGFTSQTPWTTHAGMTRPYTTAEDVDGRSHELVLLVPLGENAFLSELERYLDDATGPT